MILTTKDPDLKELALEVLYREVGVEPCNTTQAIMWVNPTSGDLVWLVGYTNFLGKTCQMHVVKFKGHLSPKQMLKACFDYPFNQLGLKIVFGIVNSNNKKALHYDQRLGFKEAIRFPKVHTDDGDLVVLQMNKDECRWIREGNK